MSVFQLCFSEREVMGGRYNHGRLVQPVRSADTHKYNVRENCKYCIREVMDLSRRHASDKSALCEES